MTTHLLDVRNLRKVFHVGKARGHSEELVAVDDVSFSLERNSSLAVVGESGSGKTTTARIIAGLESATGGSIELDGKPLASPNSPRSRRLKAREIQMVFQDPFGSLDPRQKVGACIDELLAAHFDHDKAWRRDRTMELLAQVGLDERHADELPRRLSGGQRQRVAIARALSLEPKLLILDEAVSALDVSVQAQVLNLLSDIRESLDITYLFVSHDLAVVRQISDHCIVMDRGRVIEMGSTATVLDSPAEDYTKQLLDAIPRPGWTPSRRRDLPASV